MYQMLSKADKLVDHPVCPRARPEVTKMNKVFSTVRNALSGREPIFLTAEKTVREAAVILSDHGIGAAPVLDGDRLVGIFSERERDILRRVVSAWRDAGVMRVGDALTSDPRSGRS